ncbi:16S rRNA (uracil(1498)-N(3))-methyltransferase [Geoalkalibacter subterraneus]|uniref:Ribosomal RNA small subunit methyltransferase E n=1 Tax=Geoalkalibacter subterraneus TaxID=483547 RepID=A0A0B5FEA9_9BACT|nr:16S rRNA (uracil(1498)-N(3))-methyltransferase [Geoalkalibacter subterraneus]AJF05623.1 hypothetical protein GSUB_02260 [Geoalkalibacter subterraneus]
MRCFFVDPILLDSNPVLLEGDLHHQLSRVLRLAPGAPLCLFDGQGQVVHGELEALSKNVSRVRVLTRFRENPPPLSLRLIQALPKGEKMDLILQKGTELGVSRFTPWLAARSIARPSGDRQANRLKRWERIVREAAQQSRRPFLPRIDAPQTLGSAIGGQEQLKLVLWEQESMPLAHALPTSPPAEVAIMVGPEGGLTEDEVAQASSAGFVPVGLGRHILRTETAGFAVVAILEYLYGDFGRS